MKTTAVWNQAPQKLFLAKSFFRYDLLYSYQALQSQQEPLLKILPQHQDCSFLLSAPWICNPPPPACTAAQKTPMTQHKKVLQGLEYSSIYRSLNLTKKTSTEHQSNCYLDVSRPSQGTLAYCHVFKSYPVHWAFSGKSASAHMWAVTIDTNINEHSHIAS